jgi:hemoglobin
MRIHTGKIMTSLGKLSISVAAALAIASAAQAQTDTPPLSPAVMAHNAGGQPMAGDAVYKAFHGREGIERVVRGLLDRVTVDPRTAASFKTTNLKRLKGLLVEQICYLTGGPCEYHGDDMRTVHKGLDLTQVGFNAVAEDLQLAMDAEHVPFNAQNRLLAKLAPMEPQIVTK